MDEATKGLVVAVKETLKDFTSGRLSTEECRRRYRQMISDCESLERGADRSAGPMKSLCYAHSTGNFALFTGIYRMDHGSLTPLSSCGDDVFNVSIKGIRDIISSRLSARGSVSMPPGDAHSLPHTVYACLIPGKSGIPLLFAAISSSHFFSENEFIKTANFVGAFRDFAEYEMHPQFFSFFSERRAAVDKWIEARIDEGLSVYAHYFLFNMVERIFSHMGLPEMLKISASIKDSLHAQCGTSGTVVFELSMREYLVFIPDPAGTGCEKKKASFDYHGSSIPSQSCAFTIRKTRDIIDFWNEILEFEHRLATGEKRK
ncbi:MAG TPA: hypothetical protein VLM75_15045 [Spirochaetota bacterium]|nr:hypothetical protein [Spirochaetota bacterium]